MNNELASFEDGIKELEMIVSSLEQGDLPLEKAVELFEKGKEIVVTCTKMLDEAEAKITRTQ
jgi:exodeoxyribonuclease VII small subunit